MKTWLLACSMAFVGTGLHAAQIPAAADSSISSKKLTAKLGAGKTLTVDKQTNTMIRFDLSSLSSDVKAANVAKATLRLWINAKPTPGSLAVALPGSAWSESLVSGSTAPGFIPTGVTKVLPTEGNAYFDLDMTAVVKSWLDGTPNNGLVLTPEIAGNPLKVVFDSRESTKPGRGPVLDLEIVELPVFRTFEFDIPAAAWDEGFHWGDGNVHHGFLINPTLTGGIDLASFYSQGGTVVAYAKVTGMNGYSETKAMPYTCSISGTTKYGIRVEYSAAKRKVLLSKTTNGWDSEDLTAGELPSNVKIRLTLIGPAKIN